MHQSIYSDKDTKKYLCDICNKDYVSRDGLKKHRRTTVVSIHNFYNIYILEKLSFVVYLQYKKINSAFKISINIYRS